MTFRTTADEELDDYYGDIDDLGDYDDEYSEYDDVEVDDRSPFGLRTGGTDLFRAVMVLLIAGVVGALILARGFGDADDSTDADDEAADSVDADATGTPPADTDTDGGLADDGSVGDTGATGGTTPDSMAGTDGDGETGVVPGSDDSSDAMTDGTDTSGLEGDDTGTASSDSGTDTGDTDGAGTGLDIGEGSVARDPQEVEVLVLNATDQQGIAGQASGMLQAADYNVAPAGNATVAGMGSVIYYQDGYRADALAVADVFTDGLDGLVQALDPTQPPTDELGSANVIVVLGTDDAIPIG